MSILINCFRKMTEESNKTELRGYKVTNVDRNRRFGVACRNFQELKRKACAKFNISNEELKNVKVFLVDGSLIDEEYFLTVEPQTTLILQRPGEKILSDADILYNTLRQVNLEFLTTGDAVEKFLSKNLKSKVAVLNKILNKDDTKTSLSSRDEHPEWFQHLETTLNTKEAYMHRRCQDRIRSYLYKTIDQIKSSEVYANNETARRHLTYAMSYFKLQLREDHCLGFYFDRSFAAKVNKKRNELSESESETETKKNKDEGLSSRVNDADEFDGAFNCPYDHCPCKIQFISGSFPSERLEIEKDELDAKKARSRLPVNDDTREDYSPYKIQIIDKRLIVALCDYNGEFYCDGVWNAEKCAYGERHCINPYRSYEELVLFSTWNFDHRIERSRTLIPNLLKASEQEKISQKDIRYYYDNIFTVKNLRLVHIICHDKGAHSQKQ